MHKLHFLSSCGSFLVAMTAFNFLGLLGYVEGIDEPPMEEAHKQDIKLFEYIYHMLQSCVITEDVVTGDCLEMFRGAHPHDPKYNKCKCLVPCVAKKLDLMYTDGTFDFNGIRNITKNVQSDYYRKEIERVLDICETEPGTECEAGYNIINCAIQHSHVAGRSIRMMMEALDEHLAQSTRTEKPKDDDDD